MLRHFSGKRLNTSIAAFGVSSCWFVCTLNLPSLPWNCSIRVASALHQDVYNLKPQDLAAKQAVVECLRKSVQDNRKYNYHGKKSAIFSLRIMVTDCDILHVHFSFSFLDLSIKISPNCHLWNNSSISDRCARKYPFKQISVFWTYIEK